jgi:PucR family transcriptional regulator, purine catabolism regulatory protein
MGRELMHASARAAREEQAAGTASPEAIAPPPVGPALTLGRLLSHDGLGLKLVAGGPESHERSVTGAALLDASPGADLDGIGDGTLALAGGALAELDAAGQRELVTELHRRGASALGLAVGSADERVPRPPLEEAMRLGFPLFVAPPPMSRAELAGLVEAARAQFALEDLQRSVSAQDYLMEALSDPRPVDALVRRLAWLLAGEALLFNDGGHVVTATGVVRSEEIWDEIARREPEQQQFDVGAGHITSKPVVIGGRVRYWLAAVTRRRDGAGELALLRVVERLLELVTLARTVADDDEQALRSGLLGNALEERDPRQLQEIARRAERFGITYADPCRVVVATLRAPGRWAGAPAAPSPAERLRRLLASGHTPYLVDEQPERLIALIQGESGEVEAWVRALEREGIDLVAGIGRSHDTLPEAQASLLDAELAVQQVDAGRGAAVVRFEDCDLARWTIGVAAERLEPKVEALLAEIKADPRLYETLVAYLDSDLDVRATASELHLHVNSVRYRLGRIEAIVGRSLQRLATLADLYIAVTVDRTTASARARPAR